MVDGPYYNKYPYSKVYVSAISTQYIYYKVNIPLIYILTSFFQPLLPDSRPMTSCHVTAVTCLFMIQELKLK